MEIKMQNNIVERTYICCNCHKKIKEKTTYKGRVNQDLFCTECFNLQSQKIRNLICFFAGLFAGFGILFIFTDFFFISRKCKFILLIIFFISLLFFISFYIVMKKKRVVTD